MEINVLPLPLGAVSETEDELKETANGFQIQEIIMHGGKYLYLYNKIYRHFFFLNTQVEIKMFTASGLMRGQARVPKEKRGKVAFFSDNPTVWFFLKKKKLIDFFLIFVFYCFIK